MMLTPRYSQGPIKVREIALNGDLPEEFLELILLELKRARIVKSSRSPNGGYQVSRSPAKIRLSQISGLTFGIFTVKADGTGLATVLTQSAFLDTPAFSPDGKKIVFVNYGLTGSTTYGVVSVNLDDSNQTLLVGSAQESEVLNSSVYYSAYDATVSNQRIYKCDLDGSNAVAITDGSTYDYLGIGNMI